MHGASKIPVLLTAILGPATLLASFSPAQKRLSDASGTRFLPVAVGLGTAPSMDTYPFSAFTLTPDTPLATVDYGAVSGGYPVFTVASLSQPVQVEVKYSESFVGLYYELSDGPFTFRPSLANGQRVETFNITQTGSFAAPLVQGGQRWQTLELLTEGSITFESVATEAGFDTSEVTALAGGFTSGDDELDEIWNLGARAATAACVAKGSQRQVWEMHGEKGVYVRSTRPAESLNASLWKDYTLDFDVMIDRAGVWWDVASAMSGQSGAIQLMLVSELPEDTTFVNTNTTTTPPNSLVIAYGFGFVTITTLVSYPFDTFPMPFTVKEKTWYHISTSLDSAGHLAVSVDSQQICNISIWSYDTGDATVTTTGSFGFGGWRDQSAWVRNVSVTDTASGESLYTNAMTDASVVPAEYGTQANVAAFCLDGPKRDRLVWLGDFYHTARVMGPSTGRHDLSWGTMEFFLRTQIEDGQLHISPVMGYDAGSALFRESFAPDGDYGLHDYQLLGLGALYSYVQYSGDVDSLADSWVGWKKVVEFAVSHINSTDGLVHFNSAFVGPAAGGSAVSCLTVQMLRQMASIACEVGDMVAQTRWTRVADDLELEIKARLWNDNLGVFALSTSALADFSLAGVAFCISSGVASAGQAMRSIAAAREHLKLHPGYKDSTEADSSNPDVYISPNINGFFLDALYLAAGDKSTSGTVGNTTALDMGGELLRSLWGAMSSNESTRSGGSWEYVAQTGEPGLGLFTSLSHPWGGAATYILSERVLGLRPEAGAAGFGLKNWVLDLDTGVRMGLTAVSGRVKTPHGILAASWNVVHEVMEVNISSPAETSGRVVYRNQLLNLTGRTEYSIIIPKLAEEL